MRFAAAAYRDAITEKLDAGLTLQRVWQDLVEEFGYGASYESVKRYARTLAPRRRAVGVFPCALGAEAQVDFFRGAPTLDGPTGQWRRPWVCRMTLGHSRHGYEEAVWDQRLDKSNAFKGRRFDSLDTHNAHLRHWNRTIARLRLHGTTRRQVWTHFVETEQRALQPLAVTAFPFLRAGERTVHTDGHVEVDGAFYPVPLALLGQRVRVQWDEHLVRVFAGDTLAAVQRIVATGTFAPRAGEAEASTRQQAFVDRLLGQCARVGPVMRQWADAAIAARGVRAIRLIPGVLSLTRPTSPRARAGRGPRGACPAALPLPDHPSTRRAPDGSGIGAAPTGSPKIRNRLLRLTTGTGPADRSCPACGILRLLRVPTAPADQPRPRYACR